MSLQGARDFLLRRRGIADGSTRLRPIPRRLPASLARSMKAARERARQEGRCHTCLTRPIAQGRSVGRCHECLDAKLANDRDRTERGLCRNCPAPRLPGRTLCAEHHERARVRTREAKRRAREAKRREVQP